MRKHHSEVFSGVLKPSVHEADGVVKKTGMSTGTGVMRNPVASTAGLGTSSGLMERVDAYINKMRAEKKADCRPTSPVQNPQNHDEFLVVVYCSWEEPEIPIAPVVGPPPNRASNAPKVRETSEAALPVM